MLHTARLLKTITERNKTDKGQRSSEDKGKMTREEDTWTSPK